MRGSHANDRHAAYSICTAQLSMVALTTECRDISHLDVLVDNAERDATDV